MAKWIHFRDKRCQKYPLYQKFLQLKVGQKSISHMVIDVISIDFLNLCVLLTSEIFFYPAKAWKRTLTNNSAINVFNIILYHSPKFSSEHTAPFQNTFFRQNLTTAFIIFEAGLGSAPKWIYFPIFEHYNISKDDNLCSSLAPLLGEIDVCTHWFFCTEFNAQQLLREAFLDIIHIFDSIEP